MQLEYQVLDLGKVRIFLRITAFRGVDIGQPNFPNVSINMKHMVNRVF